MRCYLARGYLGDTEPTVYEADIPAIDLKDREYWTWIDIFGRPGLTVVRPSQHFTKLRLRLEWGMYAIECELKKTTFHKLLSKRMTFADEKVAE